MAGGRGRQRGGAWERGGGLAHGPSQAGPPCCARMHPCSPRACATRHACMQPPGNGSAGRGRGSSQGRGGAASHGSTSQPHGQGRGAQHNGAVPRHAHTRQRGSQGHAGHAFPPPPSYFAHGSSSSRAPGPPSHGAGAPSLPTTRTPHTSRHSHHPRTPHSRGHGRSEVASTGCSGLANAFVAVELEKDGAWKVRAHAHAWGVRASGPVHATWAALGCASLRA